MRRRAHKLIRRMSTVAVAAALLALPVASAADIAGTAHDFSATGWTSNNQICVACHTPHNGDTTIPGSPLWNHEITATAAFGVYASSTLNAGPMGQPDGLSKLCLSCHDGSVALDNFGGVTTGSTFISGNALLGTDLSNDHPISFTYDPALATADGELWDPTIATVAQLGGGTIDATMLFGGQMECASCHDVHGITGVASLLRFSNANSDLCLTCHDK